MAKARVRGFENLDNLLRSEVETIITQANLGNENSIIAQRYFLDGITQIEIADELGYFDRKTVGNRIPKILDKMDRAAKKLNMI